MPQKLFTKEIEKALFAQFRKKQEYADKGEEMPEDEDLIICKIFNPYGRGTWFVSDADPDDPDYLYGIVDLFEVEMGSFSRAELEGIKLPPFGLPLERDISFGPEKVSDVYKGLLDGKHFANGGQTDGDDELSNAFYKNNEKFAEGGTIDAKYKAGGEVNYFDNALKSARKKYEEYKNSTDGQREHLAFLGAGNLSKGASSRFNTIRDKSGRLLIDLGRRELFKEMYDAKIFGFAGTVNWSVLNKILSKCHQNAFYNDETDYYGQSFEGFGPNLNTKYEAISNFINRYGTSTDKKYLLPKFNVENPDLRKFAEGGNVAENHGMKEGFYIIVTPTGKGFKPHIWIEGGKFNSEPEAEFQAIQIRKQKDIYKKVQVVHSSKIPKFAEGGDTSFNDYQAELDTITNRGIYELRVAYSKKYDSVNINVIDSTGYPWSIERVPFKVAEMIHNTLGDLIEKQNSGKFKKGGRTTAAEGEWVVYVDDSQEPYAIKKSHRAAKMLMNTLWDKNEFETIGMMSKEKWDQEHAQAQNRSTPVAEGQVYHSYSSEKDFKIDKIEDGYATIVPANEPPSIKNTDMMEVNQFRGLVKAGAFELKNSFAKGGLTRAKRAYNKDVDAYKYFLVNLVTKRAESGWEFKQDAIDAKNEMDNNGEGYKVMAKISLKGAGIPDPSEEWKKYNNGGETEYTPSKAIQRQDIRGHLVGADVMWKYDEYGSKKEIKKYGKIDSITIDTEGKTPNYFTVLFDNGRELNFTDTNHPESSKIIAYPIEELYLSDKTSYASGGPLEAFIPEQQLMDKLKGESIILYYHGEDDGNYEEISSARITDEKFDNREVVLKLKRGGEERFPLSQLRKFMNLDEITVKSSTGEPYIMKLSRFIEGIYKPLRSVKVTFDNGEVLNTSISANSTDKQIRDYYKVGRKLNIGTIDDKMATITEVEISK